MYWLIVRNPELSTDNKLHMYKAIFNPMRTYGIELWGTASTSNIEMLERFKGFQMIVEAPWYDPNTII
jgi:hypothetical protein